MKQESKKAVDEIMAILDDKGEQLSQDDRLDIDMISIRIANSDMADCWPWVEEAIAQVITSPTYQGDIPPEV